MQAQAHAQSFQAKAHSLEKAAEAQNLQVSMASFTNILQRLGSGLLGDTEAQLRVMMLVHRLRRLLTSRRIWKHSRMRSISRQRPKDMLRLACKLLLMCTT